MIEETICGYLSQALSVPAWPEEPESAPERYIIVQRTGGGERNHVRRATVAVQSYGESLYQAAALHEEVLSAMGGITALPHVSACAVNSEYNYTDTRKHKYRYQAVFDLVYF